MMNTAWIGIQQPGQAISQPRLLGRVVAWELRRVLASRILWLQALGFLGISLFLTLVSQIPLTLNHADASVPFFGFVAETSAWGLFLTLPSGTLMVLGMLLPFVNADGTTRDRSRRTYELLMATVLPTWAYVWGRYLSGLVLSLGLSLLALVPLIGLGWLWQRTVPDYPAPDIGNLIVIWFGLIASATILVSSLSFAFGTLLPRLTTLVKIVILMAWFVGSGVMSMVLGNASHSASFHLPAWYVYWDPTSEGLSLGLFRTYMANFSNLSNGATSTAQVQQSLLTVENTLIDLGSWFTSHLLLAGLSLVLVLAVALVFKRSRETLG